MSEYYHVVPWFNSEEWHQVYEKIYSSTSTTASKQEALNLLLVWKARCPSLPSGVESTLTLLEVYLLDLNNYNDTVNEQLLRLGYSSAIMRFVNHMLDSETAKGTSLYQAAKNLGVPDWIIDLRHDTAHSYNLPSIELLREACSISLDWLYRNYWEEHKLVIQDYIFGQKGTDSNDENKITALMNFCISLSICAFSKVKIKNLADIPDMDMRESIINDARDLFGEQIDVSNLKTVSIMGLINLLNAHSKKLLKSNTTTTHVNKALLGEESLFLSLELLDYVNDTDFYRKNRLSKQYVQCFEVLLTFLHSNDLILDFVLELIKISEDSCNNEYKSKLAALWASEIFKSLMRCKQFIDKVDRMAPTGMSSKKRKELKLLFRHWFPNDRNYSLLLDLQKSVPQELTNINFVQPIISTYNPNSTYFIKDMLNLIEPHLPKVTIDKICALAKLISSPSTLPPTSSRIYTVDDLKTNEEIKSVPENNDSDSDVMYEMDDSPIVVDSQPNNSIWKLASSEHSWSTCPIGLLPWQQTKNTCLDMDIESSYE